MICTKCNTQMQPGKALVNVATAGAPDFIVPYSMGTDAQLVEVLKCPKCGHAWMQTTSKT